MYQTINIELFILLTYTLLLTFSDVFTDYTFSLSSSYFRNFLDIYAFKPLSFSSLLITLHLLERPPPLEKNSELEFLLGFDRWWLLLMNDTFFYYFLFTLSFSYSIFCSFSCSLPKKVGDRDLDSFIVLCYSFGLLKSNTILEKSPLIL